MRPMRRRWPDRWRPVAVRPRVDWPRWVPVACLVWLVVVLPAVACVIGRIMG